MQLNLAKKSFYFSLIIFFSSFTFLLVSLLALPTDKACDRRRIIFSPLQDVISYKWVNYGDYFFPRSVYRTTVTRPIALDTQLAWQDLAKGLFLDHIEGRSWVRWEPGADDFHLDFEISIPEQKLESLRQSTDYQWKRHSDGGIAANVAVFHQLSCLVCKNQSSYLCTMWINSMYTEHNTFARSSRLEWSLAPGIERTGWSMSWIT